MCKWEFHENQYSQGQLGISCLTMQFLQERPGGIDSEIGTPAVLTKAHLCSFTSMELPFPCSSPWTKSLCCKVPHCIDDERNIY